VDCHLGRFEPAQMARNRCRVGSEAAPTLLLWGDSHADALFPGLANIAKTQPWAIEQRSMSSCPPVLGLLSPDTVGPNYRGCQLFNRAIVRRIAQDSSIKGIILVARWDFYEPEVAGRRLDETLAIIRGLRGLQFPALIVASVPFPGFDVPKCVARSIQFGRSDAGCMTLDTVKSENFSGTAMMVDPMDLLCKSGKCQTSLIGGKLLYRDDNHLSIEGANLMGEFIVASPAWRELLNKIELSRSDKEKWLGLSEQPRAIYKWIQPSSPQLLLPAAPR
jgi:hypothetical protein